VEEKNVSEKKKYKGLPSMKLTILIANVVAIIVAVVVFSIVCIPSVTKSIKGTIQESIFELAKAYGEVIDEAIEEFGADGMTYDRYNEIIGGVTIAGTKSSYAYVVSKDGIMLYHPTQDKVGNSVENAAVKGVVEQLSAGTVPEPSFIEYEFKGAMKYAGCYVTPDESHTIVVVTADEKECLAPVTAFITKVIVASIIIIIIVGVVMWFIGGMMMKPLEVLTEVVRKTSEFNFEKNPEAASIMDRADEAGKIGRAIQLMRSNLRDIVKQIDSTSVSLSTNALSLKDSTNQVNEDSSDNSATAQELAAGMQETSATTENITSSIEKVSNDTNEINKLTRDGEEVAKEIQDKAENLEAEIAKMRDDTTAMYAAVKEKSEVAVAQSKAVNKINDLAKAIMEIASQTSLLALNASIEAARAGESGRGFAVVAEEIGNLANQSSETVNGITAIVNEVHEAVGNMSECLDTMNDFLENKISKDYEQFINVSQQYNNDAHVFQVSLQDIRVAMDNLNVNIRDITEAIDGINNTIGEAAIGVTDIAQKTTDIVSLSSQTYDMVEESVTYADELSDIVGRFKMD